MKQARFPGAVSDVHKFEAWLDEEEPATVLAATVPALLERYRLDERWVETKLLARQGQIRRAGGAA